jgi:PAS domain S-box-containing protein
MVLKRNKMSESAVFALNLALFHIGYLLSAFLGRFISFHSVGFVNFWIPSGLFLSVLLRTASKRWPWVALAAFSANLLFDLYNGQELKVALLFASGNVLEAVSAAWLLRRFVSKNFTLATLKEAIGLLFYAAILSTPLSASLGAFALKLFLKSHNYWSAWFLWWSSDFLSILLFVPLFISLRLPVNPIYFKKSFLNFVERAAFLSILFIFCWFLFGGNSRYGLNLGYLVIPFILWSALRYGLSITSAASVICALFYGAHASRLYQLPDPAIPSSYFSLALAMLFIGIIALIGLLTAVVFAEQKRIRQALEDSEERFKTISLNTPDHVLIQDKELRYLWVLNPQLGLTTQKMIGNTDYDILSFEEAEHLTRIKKKVLASGVPEQVLLRLKSVHGGTECFDGAYIPKYDKKGNIDGLIGYFKNVTAQVQAQESLRESKHYLDSIVEGSLDAVFLKDQKGRYILVNNVASRFFGKGQSEIVGHDDTFIFAPEEAQIVMAHDKQVMACAQALTYEEQVTTADGRRRVFNSTKGPLFGKNGSVIGLYCVARDITESKRTEREQEAALEMLGIINKCKSTQELIHDAVIFFRRQSGCEAAGVRFRDGEDFPYFETRGFSAQFVLLENSLCSRDAAGELIRDSYGDPVIECMCGNVICGRFDASKPFFTESGSFWTNSTSELLASTTEADRQARTRNRCNGEGYESVALLPLRVGNERLGLLQLNSRRKGVFSAESIAFWEHLSGYLSVGLAKLRADDALRESEQRYRTLFNNMRHGFAYCKILFDEAGTPQDFIYLAVNDAFEALTGLKNVIGKKVSEVIPGIRENDPGLLQIYGRVAQSGGSENFEFYLKVLKSWFSISVYCPHPGHFVAIFDIITERKRAEEALFANKAKLDLALNAAQMGVWHFDTVENKRVFDDQVCRLLGIDPAAFKGAVDEFFGVILPDDLPKVKASLAHTLKTALPYESQYRVVLPDGSLRHISERGRLVCDKEGSPVRIIGIAWDNTERMIAEEKIKAALREKEILLQEVNHRVKNNLQIISSLVNLQAEKVTNAKMKAILKESQVRVNAIALVHQKLYQSRDLGKIDFEEYVSDLVKSIMQSFNMSNGRVRITIDVVKGIDLGIDKTVNCGLVINELVTNAFKYAFPGERSGEIQVGLKRNAAGELTLTVADNGVGLPLHFEVSQVKTLGMELIQVLANELGSLRIESQQGTKVTLTMKA